MSLTSVELDRIRYELGISLVRLGAEPFIAFYAVFTKAVAPYLTDTGSTSTTTIAAVTTGADAVVTVVANPIVTDPYGTVAFAPGVDVVVDTGPNQEFATVRAVTGLSLTLSTLSLAHGTAGAQYPVILKGAEWIVRDILTRITAINGELSSTAVQGAGAAAVDEIKLAVSMRNGKDQRDRFDSLIVQREQARFDLSYALFGADIRTNSRRRSGGGRMELY